MQKIITLSTDRSSGLYDITSEVVALVKASRVKTRTKRTAGRLW